MRLNAETCAILLLLALAGACAAPSTSAQDSGARRSAEAGNLPPQSMTTTGPADPLAGLVCEPARGGVPQRCSTPGYEISGIQEACDGDSTAFGVIRGDTPAIAYDRVGDDPRPVAELAPEQFICTYFTAEPLSDGDDGWLYVVAVPPQLVQPCTTANCGDPGARSRWLNADKDRPCRIENATYGAGCPAGWVPRSRVDEFSMGLGGARR